MLDQERYAMIQEKYKVQKLLEDMQNAVNTYIDFRMPISFTNAPSAVFPQPNNNPSGKKFFPRLTLNLKRGYFFLFSSLVYE